MIDSIREYVKLALRTESKLAGEDAGTRLDHCIAGLTTETGELADMRKRNRFYGKTLDRTNAIEELGDLLWYFAIGCDALQVDPAEVLHLNIEKLKARFPNKFNSEQALHRDLEKERAILEGTENARAEPLEK